MCNIIMANKLVHNKAYSTYDNMIMTDSLVEGLDKFNMSF